MFQFKNQLLILALGSTLIVSCTKEECESFFGEKSENTEQKDSTNNGSISCLTCEESEIDSLNGGGNNNSIDSTSNNSGGNEKDSTYNNGGGNNEIDSTSVGETSNSKDSIY